MSKRRRTRTASTSTVETTPRTRSTSTVVIARGTHAFKIDRYSLHRGRLGVGSFVRSATFGVGGYDWSIRFYPNGCQSSEDYVAVFLELMSADVAKVTATFDLSLVDQATGQSTVLLHNVSMDFTSDVTNNPSAVGSSWGRINFKKRSELEASSSTFLRDDCLVIQCDVTVPEGMPRAKETAAAAISAGSEVVVQMPPSDLSDNLRRLLELKQGADVTFKVRDEVFPAHKVILAMRSPVFSAEFFGPVAVACGAAAESTSSQCVTVEDMHPDIFGALLHFVYTDTVPAAVDELDAGERKEMLRHLLVAADRYAMERLKLMCEASLCESIGVENVADMAALADRYHCKALGHACAEFIASSNEKEIGDVVASQGYVHLKKTCPAVLVDMFEKVTVALCVMQRCPS